MKSIFARFLAVAVSSGVSLAALAHGDLIEMTTLSVKEGMIQLKKDHPEHASHFTGVKVWPVGADMKLKVYLPDNTTINYTCVHKDQVEANAVVCTMEM